MADKTELIKWLEDKINRLNEILEVEDDSTLWGQRNAFIQVRDKINAL